MNMLKYWCKMRHSVGQFQFWVDWTLKRRACALRSNALFEDLLGPANHSIYQIWPTAGSLELLWVMITEVRLSFRSSDRAWSVCVTAAELHCCAQSACASLLPEEERSLARPWAAVAPHSFAFAPLLLLLDWSVWYHGADPNLVKRLPRIPDIVKSCIVVKIRV